MLFDNGNNFQLYNLFIPLTFFDEDGESKVYIDWLKISAIQEYSGLPYNAIFMQGDTRPFRVKESYEEIKKILNDELASFNRKEK